MKRYFKNKINVGLIILFVIGMMACKDQLMEYEQTRLFRPVLGKSMEAKENTIILRMGDIKDAKTYTIEISRDTFKIIDFTVQVDSNYVELNQESLGGNGLYYNTLYQVRAKANAENSQYDSKFADFGSVKTERLVSNMRVPESYHVTDTKALVSWNVTGNPITQIKTFANTDLGLNTPLNTYSVSTEGQTSGEFIIDGLNPSTKYQIAIFSNSKLRGYVDYQTLEKGIDPNGSNVIDLSENEDINAVENAISTAPSGAIILLKRGFRYNLPQSNLLSNSITIKGAYGFTPQKAQLFTNGNWNITNGAQITSITFDDVEIIGNDFGANYVFNINNSTNTIIDSLTFKNCIIQNLRGVVRIRSSSFIKNFKITGSTVYHIGGYGILTCDTDGANKAAVDNVLMENSTFYQLTTCFTTRQNFQNFEINSCTFNEAAAAGQRVFYFRGKAGFTSVVNGININNTIWGSGWDSNLTGNLPMVIFSQGLDANTTVTVTNTWATADLSILAGYELSGFPSLNYSNNSTSLWADPKNGNFNLADPSFGGRTDAGDPKWRKSY